MSPELAKFLVIQGISLGGVLVLIALAWLIGFRQRARILDKFHVWKLAADDRVGPTGEVAVDALGRTALAEIDTDKVYVVKALGDRLTTRVFPRSAVAGVRMYRPRGRGIGARVRFSDAGFDDLAIEFESREAPAWIERLRRGAWSK
ncbi:MAG: hypothetical protein IV086_06945 [Hyphomonadaceae bacterium]|nr:MAG: hypothetical protein FD160_2691 [Caulobacteraceae bacterium]MBT9445416.1 hypothetical protein [Hyphomonadaceae bacterium]TPW07008.1 MAG: hypothetical protein FD124_1476 [Alphaproteobacteria bacterium]